MFHRTEALKIHAFVRFCELYVLLLVKAMSTSSIFYALSFHLNIIVYFTANLEGNRWIWNEIQAIAKIKKLGSFT